MKLSCPSCGGEVDFKSRSSVYQVCPYCASMLLRTDINLENLGKSASLPPEMTPFQLGTTGTFDGIDFVLIGKQRMQWSDGYWTEWYLNFSDQSQGWLAVAQGFLMISVPSEDYHVPALRDLKPGDQVHISGKYFEVDDIKKVTCEGSSGELPVKGIKGRKLTSVDLTGEGETFANVIFSDDGTEVYVGRYVDSEELKLSNLREIDGW